MVGMKGENRTTTSRKYWVVNTVDALTVRCEIEDDVGWTLLMRRSNMDISFDKNWTDYRNGFGNMTGNVLFSQ